MDRAESRRETLQLFRRFVEERRELGDGFWPKPERPSNPPERKPRTVVATAARPPVSAERFLMPEKPQEHEIPRPHGGTPWLAVDGGFAASIRLKKMRLFDAATPEDFRP